MNNKIMTSSELDRQIGEFIDKLIPQKKRETKKKLDGRYCFTYLEEDSPCNLEE